MRSVGRTWSVGRLSNSGCGVSCCFQYSRPLKNSASTSVPSAAVPATFRFASRGVGRINRSRLLGDFWTVAMSKFTTRAPVRYKLICQPQRAQIGLPRDMLLGSSTNCNITFAVVTPLRMAFQKSTITRHLSGSEDQADGGEDLAHQRRHCRGMTEVETPRKWYRARDG